MKKKTEFDRPRDLEGILHSCFGCGKVFCKNPVKIDEEADDHKIYRNVTIKGMEAYKKLTATVYALETMGVISDANDIIEQLDNIISENGAYF